MGTWPKSQMLRHPPELPMAERVRRYQHNIRAIRASGCKVPTPAMPDTLDPVEIEEWFETGRVRIERLNNLIRQLAQLPDDTLVPSPFIGGPLQ